MQVTPSSTTQGSKRPAKEKPGALDFLTTVPGILTGLAALITAVGGAFYSGTQLSSGTPQPAATVTVTAPARTVTAAAVAAHPSGSPSQPTPQASGTAQAVGTVYLATLTPLQDNEPWAGGSASEGPQQIGSVTYADSVRFACGPQTFSSSLVYDVAGYATFKATIGVPSDATNASGNSTTVQFLKDGSSVQLIPSITTALDQPQAVTIPLMGASQLEISCTSSASAQTMDIVLGTATLAR